jgi:hypothetical protein
MIFGRRRPEPIEEPQWDDPMWVPQPVERWIEPEEVAARLRRRRGRWRALRHSVVLLLVILVVGGIGVIAGGAVLGRWDLPWAPTPSSLAAEPTASAAPSAPVDCEPVTVVPAGVQGTSVQVLNATNRNGLAGTVGDELQLRGFTVTDVGNYRDAVTEPAVVLFPEGAEPAALAVAAHLQGAVLRPDAGATVVTAVLGEAWTGVTTVEEAAEAARQPQPSVVACEAPGAAESEAGATAEPTAPTG